MRVRSSPPPDPVPSVGGGEVVRIVDLLAAAFVVA
jgi:hypothetical protein